MLLCSYNSSPPVRQEGRRKESTLCYNSLLFSCGMPNARPEVVVAFILHL